MYTFVQQRGWVPKGPKSQKYVHLSLSPLPPAWEQHIKALSKKLASCTGSLNRIIQFLPKNMHKELYYTLFESYLAYGVTVWGKASKSKLRLLFKAQKKAIRVVFGNKEQFLDKFRTCAKARPYPDQKLGQEFFNKEHANHILTLQNLNFYHTCSEIFKIFKYRNLISIYQFSKNLNFQLEDLKIFSLPPHIPQICISTMPVWPGTLLEHS